MSVVTERNFDQLVTDTMRDEFWYRVARSLGDIFHADPELATDYRKSVEDRDGLGRILPYHDDPLQIAADLAGQELAAEHVELYERLFPEPIHSDQSVATLP